MGLFDWFKRGKKKSEAELESQYEAELNPVEAIQPTVVQPAVEKPRPAPAAVQPVIEQKPAPAPVVPKPTIEAKPAEPKPVVPAPVPAPAAIPAPIPAAAAPTAPAPLPMPAPVQPGRIQTAYADAVKTAETAPAPAAPQKRGFFGRLKEAVTKTRLVLNRKVAGIVGLGQKIDEDVLDKLEEALIESDMGVESTEMLMEDIRRAWKSGDIVNGEDIFPFLKADLKRRLSGGHGALKTAASGPTVILVVGVNGAGKTTSIAKMARIHVLEGQKVLLAAGDTFRAAAVEQLVTWSARIGCEVVTGKQGSDPAAVAYAACERAVAGNFDVLLIDTAGRLHTQKNLMDELAKIYKVIGKVIPTAPHETIMVLDATTGQNAVNQARMFREVANVSGIFLAKLDGTAKGGAVLTIDRQVGIPVKYVGLGESFEDVQRFNAHAFVDALFDDSAAEAE